MNFLERIFLRLVEGPDAVAIRQGDATTRARELLAMITAARAFLRGKGVRRGDRVVLLGSNSARWIALDQAIASEGAVAVPLYARQAVDELRSMASDCDPRLVLADGEATAAAIDGAFLFEEATAPAPSGAGPAAEPVPIAPDDPVRIVYTSGTSGAPKGAILTAANVDFMLPRTLERLDALMRGHRGPERVYHYLPCCFMGSWILLLATLARGGRMIFATDLARIGEELRAADPHYMLNVPLLLERLRVGVRELVEERGGLVSWLWQRRWLARWTLFPLVRRQLAPSLRALICGSAPLAEETQRFFMMLGLPVLQVYGLTETTAICTMDEPGKAVPGRVGPAVEGCEMKTAGDDGEILVRGPHVFAGYWKGDPHPPGAWLATGDRGERDGNGNWRILGRSKNVLVLASGHNVAPEPLEQRLRLAIRGATQVVLVGDGRPAVAAIVAGAAERPAVAAAVDALNADLPHYERVRAFHLHDGPLTPEEGLLTANGKLRRDAIRARFAGAIEEMYRS